MPTYLFRDKDTNEEYEKFMKISELDQYLAEHNVTQLVNGFPGNLSGMSMKPDDSFRDVLREIKKNNSGLNVKSTINTF